MQSFPPSDRGAGGEDEQFFRPNAVAGVRRFDVCFLPWLIPFFFTMDMSDTVNYVMWVVVALINGPVYYCVGLIFAALMKLSLWKS